MKILKKMSSTAKVFVFAALVGIILGVILGIFDIDFTINEPYRTIATVIIMVTIAYYPIKNFVYTPIKNLITKKNTPNNERRN